jgi:hypothetical protein
MVPSKPSKLDHDLIPALLVVFLALPAWAQYSGGSGAANDPYRIATAGDLIALGDDPNGYDKHFIMAADIDLSGYTFQSAVIASIDGGLTVSSNPTEELDVGFRGSFNGMGHVIRELCIKGEDVLGLFGHVADGALVRNLGLEGVDVTGTHAYIGAIAGYNNGTITSCYSKGTVQGDSEVGGLVGGNALGIGQRAVHSSGLIQSCRSACIVTGNHSVGGLVGQSWGCIMSSAASGSTKGDRQVGGLVGLNNGLVFLCHSSGPVVGDRGVGGLVGNMSGHVLSCYSVGSVTGIRSGGGLIGECGAFGTVTSSYCTGLVVGEGSDFGGLLGINGGTDNVLSSFWNIETTGKTESDGGKGLRAKAMLNGNTYLNAGWDFLGERQNGTGDLWQIGEASHPTLAVHSNAISLDLSGWVLRKIPS